MVRAAGLTPDEAYKTFNMGVGMSVICGRDDVDEVCEGLVARRGQGDLSMSIKLGVLISGSGTNLQALIDAIAAGKLDATIELVVSSRPSAYGLKRAEAAGIQTLTLSKEIYADPMVADEVIATELRRAGVDYVLMAG